MTDNIKLPPYPEGLCLREDIEDYAREAVRLNARGVPDEPDWRHPKIQGLIGSEARLRIAINLIRQILEDPNQEFTASDMEYWDTIHDDLKAALSAAQTVPEISTEHGPWIESTIHEDETYCKRCLVRSVFAGDRKCEPHIVSAPAAPQPAQQPLTVPDGFVPQTCPHCNETWLAEAQQP